LQSGGRFRWTTRVRDARRADYALVDAGQDALIAAGSVPVEDGVATIDIVLKKSRTLGQNRGALYVIAQRDIPADEIGTFADLWGAMAAYQKQLTGYLRGLRLGPGLRFIQNPFVAGGGITGAEGGVFPVSDDFHAAFHEWLSRHTGITDLNIRWG